MAGSINKVILVGNLGRDPESRLTNSGQKVVTLNVATSEKWKDGERTEWSRVVIFNEHLAGVAERFLKKGSKVYLEGSLQTRKWQGQDGQDKYTTEIVLGKFRGELQMLDGKGEGQPAEPQGGGKEWVDYGKPDPLDSDEVPF